MAERPEDDFTGDPLDRGLAAAFGPGPASCGPPDTLADSIGPLPRDTEAGHGGPLINPASTEIPDATRDVPSPSPTHNASAEAPLSHRGGKDPTPLDAVIAGRYKIRQEIGEGGMGSVYLAEQFQPVKRMVALKLIKPGMDSRNVLARFDSERQALALMGHPHIAKVLDAGSTEQGRPFFVMELVKGIPITDYCDRHRLGLPERLASSVRSARRCSTPTRRGSSTAT
jgi:hypothetical protein